MEIAKNPWLRGGGGKLKKRKVRSKIFSRLVLVQGTQVAQSGFFGPFCHTLGVLRKLLINKDF